MNPSRLMFFFNSLIFILISISGMNPIAISDKPTFIIATPQPTINPLVPPNPQGPPPGLLARMQERFYQDVPGNSVAIATLLFTIGSVIWLALSFILGFPPRKPWPVWIIPVLSFIGLAIGFYLTFIETTNTPAVCGPVGDCNSVQKSPYAYLFGVLPIGLIGMIGYFLILAGAIGQHFLKNESRRKAIWLLLWALAWFGVLFSIYLTFLEPFVIGATCMWCISSAIVMTLILWGTTPLSKLAVQQSGPDDDLDDS